MSRILGGIVPLALGICALAYAYTLSLGGLTNPGPGLWPFLISVAIILFSITLLVTESGAEDYERFTRGIRTIALGIVSLAAFVLLFALIGFIVPGFLTFVFWLRFIGGESWRLTLIVASLSTAAFYLVFAVLLSVPFPTDPIFGL